MQVQVISDVHLEHLEGTSYDEFDLLLTPSAPVLIMAGDISTYDCDLLPAFLQFVSKNFDVVLWVPGNHEYYNTHGISIREITDIMRRMCPHNVIILNNEVYDAYEKDGYIFAGATLWTQIDTSRKNQIHKSINDYKYVYYEPKMLLTPDIVNQMHAESKEFLKEVVATNRDKKVVIITHHAPSMYGTSDPYYDHNSLQSAFRSKACDEVKGDCIVLWVCGHTHHNFCIPIDTYKLISNQFGYEGEHSGLSYKFNHHVEI